MEAIVLGLKKGLITEEDIVKAHKPIPKKQRSLPGEFIAEKLEEEKT